MTTAFVLSGGGSLGAVQVGMLQALADRQITPDLLVGTSAGALNASYLAGRGTGRAALEGLAASWTATRRRHVFPIEPAHQLLALSGARPSLFTDRGLRRLITQHLDYERLEDATVPVFLVASDLLSGQEVVMSRGDGRSARCWPVPRYPESCRRCTAKAWRWSTVDWPTTRRSPSLSPRGRTPCSCCRPATAALWPRRRTRC